MTRIDLELAADEREMETGSLGSNVVLPLDAYLAIYKGGQRSVITMREFSISTSRLQFIYCQRTSNEDSHGCYRLEYSLLMKKHHQPVSRARQLHSESLNACTHRTILSSSCTVKSNYVL